MADKEVKIRIDTAADVSGAKQTEQALEHISASATKANTNAANLAKSTNTSANGFKSMGTGVQNVSFQLQDFAVQVGSGTSAMRAFSQQAPQLLSAFGPYGAVAGAVIALGPLLVQLFKGGENGAEKAKQAALDYAQTLEDFREIYGKFNLVKSIEDDAKGWADELANLQAMQALMQRIRTDETDLAKRRIQSDGNLEIANSRLELARIEKQLVTATGQDAVRLAKERDGVVKQILEKEREIAEKIRQQNEKAARDSLKDSQDVAVEAQTEADRFKRGQDQSQTKVDELQRKIDDEIKAREDSRKAIEDELELRRKSQTTSSFGDPNRAANNARIKELEEQRAALVDKNGKTIEAPQLADLKAALESAQRELTSATTASNDAAKALTEANNKLATAGFDFAKLLGNNEQDRLQEQRNTALTNQNAAQEKVYQVEQKGADAARQILDTIISELGQAANSPENKARIAAIQQTLADGLQSNEADPVEVALQQLIAKVQKEDGTRSQLLGKVTEAMGSFVSALTTVVGQLDEVKGHVRNLMQNQGSPNW